MRAFFNRLRQSSSHSVRGLRFAHADRSFRAELYAAPFVLCGAFVAGTREKAALLIGLYGLLLAFELFNTALEALCDRLTRAHCPQIGQVKDMASAAVGCVILLNLGGWVLVFGF